jgi:hypothetical protein
VKHFGLKRKGEKGMHIQVGYTTYFSIIQYVDDTLLILEACPQQLYALKAILHTFAMSTSLKVNYEKSRMFPININSEILNHLPATFNCQPGAFPFTYLSLPLSLHKPTGEDCLPLASRIERRLVSTSNLLTQGGKLQLVMQSSPFQHFICAQWPYQQRLRNKLTNIIDTAYGEETLMRRNHLWQLGIWSLDPN